MPPKSLKNCKIYIDGVEITNISNVELTPVKEDTCCGKCHNNTLPDILEVIYSGPATIVKWSDNTKTVVKHQNKYKGKKNKEPYSKEKGLAMAIAKKALGNDNKWYDTFKKFDAEE